MFICYKRATLLSRMMRELGVEMYFGLDDVLIKRRHYLLPIVNWGCRRLRATTLPFPPGWLTTMLNPCSAIEVCASKVRTFEALAAKGLPVPRWSRSVDDLVRTLEHERTLLARRDYLSGGAGIVVCRQGDSLPKADFYVERVTCAREFRVHVWQGEVLVCQAKLVPPGNTNPIHNYEQGCVFTTCDLGRYISPTQRKELETLSVRSVAACGLHFGAVDVILTRRGRFYVLEVNSAPGLRSEPVYSAYCEKFSQLVRKKT